MLRTSPASLGLTIYGIQKLPSYRQTDTTELRVRLLLRQMLEVTQCWYERECYMLCISQCYRN